LKDNNYSFESEFNNYDKLSNHKSYDFKAQLNNKEYILIEFDGRFHFEPYSSKEDHIDKFKEQRKSDISKNQFIIKNNIKLLRIPYWSFDSITNILNSVLTNKIIKKQEINKYWKRKIEFLLL